MMGAIQDWCKQLHGIHGVGEPLDSSELHHGTGSDDKNWL